MDAKRDRLQLLVTRLYDAALEGDVPSLLNLVEVDPLILDRFCIIDKSGRFSQSPLHVSANLGHLEFVKALLDINPNMCLACDEHGRNPVHVAAMKGRVYVLEELLRAKPQAAREQTHSGETALHLCVKYSQIECLKLFVDVVDDVELLNLKDNRGNNVLHLAVTTKQSEMVKFLLRCTYLEKNAINANGFTAMDICLHSVKKDFLNKEIWYSLKDAKAMDAKTTLKSKNRMHDWWENQRNSLMIVATLIATMAFQVGVSPPGGSWQDDNDGHQAGLSIMGSKNMLAYNNLMNFSTVALVTSLSVILLLISGLHVGRILVGTLMVTMWLSISATAESFFLSVNFVSGHTGRGQMTKAVRISICVWLLLLMILLLGYGFLLVKKIVKKVSHFVGRMSRKTSQDSLP